jgi:hypothetical protein
MKSLFAAIFIFCSVLPSFGQRVIGGAGSGGNAAIKVNGSTVISANFNGNQFSANGSTVSIKNGALTTNLTETAALTRAGQIDTPLHLGTVAAAGTLNLDSKRSYNDATNSGSTFVLTLATNTTVSSSDDRFIRVQINNTSGAASTWTLTGFGTPNPVGNTGTNSTGWNTIEFWTVGGVWFYQQNTGKLPGTMVDGTLDFSGRSDLTIKFNERMPFVYPDRVDGTGCTAITNDYTSSLSGKATYASSAATNANYAIFLPDAFVPTYLDSSVAMTLLVAFRIASTDTTSETFTVGYYSPASGSVFASTDYTGLSGYISFTTGTLTSAAANKVYYVTVTLTGWAAALTPDRLFKIGIARAGAANANAITIVGGALTYGRTQ